MSRGGWPGGWPSGSTGEVERLPGCARRWLHVELAFPVTHHIVLLVSTSHFQLVPSTRMREVF